MFSNIVTLKSGGYLVINQTEALVSIDVNSGRSTREHNIEDTALKTNLEAAEEVARQLRLRDLAGLVVIDFIDMEEKRNNKAVERKLNECLKNDRARIQVGRISHFGLLEMSRQRIRTGVLESSSVPCPHCAGTGLLRSTPSLALHVLRALEDTLLRSATHDITLKTRLETAFYILNQKRESLTALEARFGVTVTVVAEATLAPGQHFIVERGEPVQPRIVAEGDVATPAQRAGAPRAVHLEDIEIEEPIVEETEEEETESRAEGRSESEGERKRRRRRRRRGGRDRDRDGARDGEPRADATDEDGAAGDDDAEADGEEEGETRAGTTEQGGEGERKRRRRRRGGRRNRRDREGGPGGEAAEDAAGSEGIEDEAGNAGEAVEPVAATVTEEVPAAETPEAQETAAPAKKPRRTRTTKAKEATDASEEAVAAEPAAPAEKPARRSRAKKAAPVEAPPAAESPTAETIAEVPAVAAAPEIKSEPVVAAPEPVVQPEPEEPEDPNRPKRTGWWSRAKQVLGG